MEAMGFKIGDDIVCIINHYNGIFVEGELFKVRNILPPMCRCAVQCIDIGIKAPVTFAKMYCSKCGVTFSAPDYLIFSEKCFMHLDDYADISELKKIASTVKIE